MSFSSGDLPHEVIRILKAGRSKACRSAENTAAMQPIGACLPHIDRDFAYTMAIFFPIVIAESADNGRSHKSSSIFWVNNADEVYAPFNQTRKKLYFSDGYETSYARSAKFLLFRRTRVRRNDRNFVATTQMKSFYDAIQSCT
jgi:hypothetical protein